MFQLKVSLFGWLNVKSTKYENHTLVKFQSESSLKEMMISIWKYLVETPCIVNIHLTWKISNFSIIIYLRHAMCIYHLQVPFEYWKKKHISLLHYLSFKGDYFSAKAWFISLKARVLPKWYIRGSIHLRQSASVQWQFPTEENDKKYFKTVLPTVPILRKIGTSWQSCFIDKKQF